MAEPSRAAPPRELPAATPPARGRLGVRLDGLDPRDVDAERAAALRALVHEHALVVLGGMDLPDEDYIAFARRLGTPQIYFQPHYHLPAHPEIFVSSNVPLDGRKVGVAGTGGYWHSDYQFFPQPLPMTMVLPKRIPASSRGTRYVDMVAALERLPAGLRERIAGRRGVHEAKWRYKVQPCDIDKSITQILEEFGAVTPTVTHPLVMTHPVHGRRALYASPGFTVGVEGLTHEEGRALLDELWAVVEDPEHVHVQPWRTGDLLLWDNRQVIHMATGGLPGEPSVSYRIGVYDGLPFCADEPEGRLL